MDTQTMQAVFCSAYGPPEVLVTREVPLPEPRKKEVRIRIKAATVSTGDCEFRRSDFPLFIKVMLRLYFGLIKPKNLVLGMEYAGIVDAVGSQATRFQVGDEVLASTGLALGTNAQYKCQAEDHAMVLKPKNVSFEEAATLPVGGLNALHFLRKADLQAGEKILIHGAGGTIGTYAVQLARFFDARVTVVDLEEKSAMLLDLGAERVIDYTQEDFTQQKETYDVIFDVTGKTPYRKSLQRLHPGGRYILSNPRGIGQMLRGVWTSLTSNKRVITAMAGEEEKDLLFLKNLMESEKIKGVVDRTFSLNEVAEAHRYVESEKKQGHVLLTIS